jgi:hypothetical protein
MYWYRGCLPYGNEEYFDAEETLSDSNGLFKIKGHKANLSLLCRVDTPQFTIFKGGYKPIGLAWVESAFKIDGMKELLRFEDGLVVFKLKKLLTTEERKKNLIWADYSAQIPYENRKLFMRELNKERTFLGYDPITYKRRNKK